MDVLTLAFFVALPCLLAVALRAFFRTKNWTKLTRLLVGNLLVLGFLLSLLLLGAEVWYRYFVDTTDSLAFTKVSEKWAVRHWHVNGSGFRDNIEYPLRIAPGKRRLTFVGDSFAAGHGINDVENRFGNLIRARHRDWEVHVMAIQGFETEDEIGLLEGATDQGYQLDDVVLVYCLNDVRDLLMAHGEPFEGCLPHGTGPWFTQGSYFLDLYYYRLTLERSQFVKNYLSFIKEGYRGKYWDAQQARLTRLRDLVQSHGGRLSVVTFPFINALGTNYEYVLVHSELDHFWKNLNVTHLDLLPVYNGYKPSELTVNPHDAHPNEKAHQLAAEAINLMLWPTLTNRIDRLNKMSSDVSLP